MGPRSLAGLPPESADQPDSMRAWRQLFTWISNSNGSQYPNPEGWDTQASNAQVKATKPLGGLHLIVISQSPDHPFLLFFGAILLMGLPMLRPGWRMWLITVATTVLLLGSMGVTMHKGAGQADVGKRPRGGLAPCYGVAQMTIAGRWSPTPNRPSAITSAEGRPRRANSRLPG